MTIEHGVRRVQERSFRLAQVLAIELHVRGDGGRVDDLAIRRQPAQQLDRPIGELARLVHVAGDARHAREEGAADSWRTDMATLEDRVCLAQRVVAFLVACELGQRLR